jgi:ubiquinone/menaquinone biosynthesis C-methylase UbiE
MSEDYSNVYEDERRADAYAELQFPGTYWLAYRDLPAIISQHVSGTKALDFGCGTGRSTRFLSDLGFDAVGVDISESMLAQARKKDPEGDYRLVPEGELPGFAADSYDLVLSVFTFDNIPTMEKKVALFRALHRLLGDGGRMINLVSAPEIYVNEWASFTTKDFPENAIARSGDTVRIVMLDVEDSRPVQDIFWREEDYREAYERAALASIETYRPLAKETEAIPWVSETSISPWAIYVLRRK